MYSVFIMTSPRTVNIHTTNPKVRAHIPHGGCLDQCSTVQWTDYTSFVRRDMYFSTQTKEQTSHRVRRVQRYCFMVSDLPKSLSAKECEDLRNSRLQSPGRTNPRPFPGEGLNVCRRKNDTQVHTPSSHLSFSHSRDHREKHFHDQDSTPRTGVLGFGLLEGSGRKDL